MKYDRTIGDLCRAAGVSDTWIRALCDKGILHPIRTKAGWRLFTAADEELVRQRYANAGVGYEPKLQKTATPA